jgi:hypothetical protein
VALNGEGAGQGNIRPRQSEWRSFSLATSLRRISSGLCGATPTVRRNGREEMAHRQAYSRHFLEHVAVADALQERFGTHPLS